MTDQRRMSTADFARRGDDDSVPSTAPPTPDEMRQMGNDSEHARREEGLTQPRETLAGRDGEHGDSGMIDATSRTQLLSDEDTRKFQERWDDSQRSFIDEPRRSVEDADQLVAEVMQVLASSFAAERKSLEQQWDRGEDVSTEDLRMALQRYRSFFQRLLAI